MENGTTPSNNLVDHSTVTGRIRIFCDRKKWVISGLFLVGLMTWAIVADQKEIQVEQVNPKSPKILFMAPPDLYTKYDNKSSTFKAAGVERRLVLLPSFKLLENFNKLSVKTLHVKNVLLDAAQFSSELEEFENLEKVILDKVTLMGDFSTRVYLPKLVEFRLGQNRNLNIDDYKFPMKLKSLLFFDIIKVPSDDPEIEISVDWDLDQLLNLKPDLKIHMSIGQTILLDINPTIGLVKLNINHCDQILRSASIERKSSIKSLSLSWCSVSWVNQSIPSSLEYLNMNNAVSKKQELEFFLENSKNLNEFHVSSPIFYENISYVTPQYTELQLEVNISKFPSTIRKISVSKVMVTANPTPDLPDLEGQDSEGEVENPPKSFVSPIVHLSIETSNLTGILDDFDKIFVNVDRVAIFNLTFPEDAYRVLEKILETNAQWILMTQFQRKPKTASQQELEQFLMDVGIPDMSNEFLIERKNRMGWVRNKSGQISIKGRASLYSGRSLTNFEANYYRYLLFAFNDIQTYDDYVIWDTHQNL